MYYPEFCAIYAMYLQERLFAPSMAAPYDERVITPPRTKSQIPNPISQILNTIYDIRFTIYDLESQILNSI
jgi:hypothetical protein